MFLYSNDIYIYIGDMEYLAVKFDTKDVVDAYVFNIFGEVLTDTFKLDVEYLSDAELRDLGLTYHSYMIELHHRDEVPVVNYNGVYYVVDMYI